MQTAAILRSKTLAVCVLLVASAAPGAVDKQPAKSPRERSLPASLAAVLCERPLQAVDLASNGLFDAQVEVVTLQPKTAGAKITTAVARERAIYLATSGEQLSYAYGICPNGSAWALSFPAPEAIRIDGLKLSVSDLAGSECVPKSARVLFVPENKGRSFLVPLSSNLTAQLPDARGYASLQCVSRQFPRSGVREWALIPLGGAKPNAVDVMPPQGLRDKDELLSWINRKRTAENLPVLVLDQELAAAAQSLATRKSVHHDREALSAVRAGLQKKGVEPLGENRVQGKNLAEAAGLLWMSPSHRDLILSPRGELVGLSVADTQRGPFVVMLVGRKTAGPVAKN